MPICFAFILIEDTVLIPVVEKLEKRKKIAEKLYISFHTVVSHRKNIVQKTGIKSVSGLTIYAVSNRLIDLATNLEQV